MDNTTETQDPDSAKRAATAPGKDKIIADLTGQILVTNMALAQKN